MVLFLYVCLNIRHIHTDLGVVRPIVQVLTIWLFSSWVRQFVKFWQGEKGAPFPQNLTVRILVLVRAARAFGVGYVIVASILGEKSVILYLGRLLFEIAFLLWTASFSKALRSVCADRCQEGGAWPFWARPLVLTVVYAIATVGLLVDLAGYGNLALYWFISWGRTVVVLLWASIFLFVLQKWHSDFADSLSSESESRLMARPVKWLLIRLAWVAWLVGFAVCLLFAWGAKQTVLLDCIQFLSRPIQVGSIRFSPVGFVYAFFILLITRTAARFWRHILERKLLVDSGLETGVQESVASITVYVLWALGIVIALTALGFSTTSLTVALGALGVGLGFGLQNIFNNFVSGLILLFERPVQVGDAIELNGTWGTISKIRVRSTVVQTYDNASLIIPNADMISNQVTNWSFRDLRLRRWITVGVAYGSDTELVRETLLEIAQAEPKVLNSPRPDVLFRDFGDSALIFSLRVWSTIDHFLAMETAVRFEIDRLFRERRIEIAFPQRDIHIRSVAEGAEPLAPVGQHADITKTEEPV
jgi:small-conductance mechanosensitive channel